MLLNYLNTYIHRQRGAVLALFALVAMPIMLALSALAVDMATVYTQKEQLQNAADAGALAGATQLGTDITVDANKKTITENYIKKYVELNSNAKVANIDSSDFDDSPDNINILATYTTSDDKTTTTKTVAVELRRRVPLYFMKLIGFSTMPIAVSATGQYTISNTSTSSNSIFKNMFTIKESIKSNNTIQGGNDKYATVIKTMDGSIVVGSNNITYDNASNIKTFFTSNAYGKLVTEAQQYKNVPKIDTSLNVSSSEFEKTISDSEKTANKIGQNAKLSELTGVNSISSNFSLTVDGKISNSDPVYIIINQPQSTINININQNVDTVQPVILYYLGTNQINIAGNAGATFRGIIYAPNAPVLLNENSLKFTGSIVAKELSLNSPGQYVYSNFGLFNDTTSFSTQLVK